MVNRNQLAGGRFRRMENIMKKTIGFLAFCFSLFICTDFVFAQISTVTINGSVGTFPITVDGPTSVGAGVTVGINGTNITTVTDLSGNYTLTNIPAGSHIYPFGLGLGICNILYSY